MAPKPKSQTNPNAAEKSRQSIKGEPLSYEVRLTQSAAQAYARFFRLAEEAKNRGDVVSSHYTTLNMIDHVIDHVIPQDPFNKRYALTRGLSRIFRMQKGRLRICWTGSSSTGIIYVLFISETLRKAGDANDPYELLTKMVMSGQFNSVFEELGVPHPSSVPRLPIIKQ